MAFVEDRSVYFAEFGDDATLAGQPVRVIFDEPSDQQIDQRIKLPQVQIDTDQVPVQSFNAALVILTGRGTGNYTVRDNEPDGTGMSLLMLTRAA